MADDKPKKVWYAPYKFQAYGDEEIAAVTQCLKDGWLAPGPKTAEFENQVAAIFGKKYGVFVNSGSSANMLALLAAGVGPGDEVVTCALTFATTIAPIMQLGAIPVFCDSEHARYVPSVEQIAAIITPKTKCIFTPNLVGSKPDWAKLKQMFPTIPLIEDSCDTITYTPESDIAVTSFYASHIITAGGGGGMVLFNDKKQVDTALMYRDWGRIGNNTEDMSERFAFKVDEIDYDFKFLYGVVGYNFKSTEMNAAFGLVQLEKLPKFKAIRAHNINKYCVGLQGTSFVLPIDHEKYDWLAMPFMHPLRKQVLDYLESNEVQTRVCFAGNITRHPAYRQFLQVFPEADRVMKEGFLLGAHHGCTDADIDRVIALLIEFDKKYKAGEIVAPSSSAADKNDAHDL